MKKILFTTFILFIGFAKSVAQSNFDISTLNAEKTRLVLVHPTAYNINIFKNLIERKVIEIQNLELVGVYFEDEKYDFENTVDFIRENNLNFVNLIQVNSELTTNNLFQKNGCTDQFRKVFENSDGIVFFGGPDIPPAVYGQKTNLLTAITDPYRHLFELSFLFHLLGGSQNENFKAFMEEKPDYLVYGFCLGMQTMNVATGGTMFQDIPTNVYNLKYADEILSLPTEQQHRNYQTNLWTSNDILYSHFHPVKFLEDKFFTTKMNFSTKNHPLVNSSHHQAVDKIGKNLEVVATSMDGKIIEALVHTKYPNVVGVQFHPERIGLYDHEIKYKQNHNKNQKPVSFYDLIGDEGMDFHKQYWKYFERTLLQIKK